MRLRMVSGRSHETMMKKEKKTRFIHSAIRIMNGFHMTESLTNHQPLYLSFPRRHVGSGMIPIPRMACASLVQHARASDRRWGAS